jgi:hypothetical protein
MCASTSYTGAPVLSLDRKAFVDIIAEAQGNVGGVMLRHRRGCGECISDVVLLAPRIRCGSDPDTRSSIL